MTGHGSTIVYMLESTEQFSGVSFICLVFLGYNIGSMILYILYTFLDMLVFYPSGFPWWFLFIIHKVGRNTHLDYSSFLPGTLVFQKTLYAPSNICCYSDIRSYVSKWNSCLIELLNFPDYLGGRPSLLNLYISLFLYIHTSYEVLISLSAISTTR